MVSVFPSLDLHKQNAEQNKTPHCIIDQAIFEAEKEVEEGGKPIALDIAMEKFTSEKVNSIKTMKKAENRNL